MTFGPVFVVVRRDDLASPWRIEGASFVPEIERFHPGDEETRLLVCSVIDEREIPTRSPPFEESEDPPAIVGLCRTLVVLGNGKKRLCDLPHGHDGECDPFPNDVLDGDGDDAAQNSGEPARTAELSGSATPRGAPRGSKPKRERVVL